MMPSSGQMNVWKIAAERIGSEAGIVDYHVRTEPHSAPIGRKDQLAPLIVPRLTVLVSLEKSCVAMLDT
jgi:hypothetical protein